MYPEQHFTDISADALVDRVTEKKEQGYRLVQICCTNVAEGFELLYTFEKDLTAECLRLTCPKDTEIQSVSGVFWPAFLYENEMKDLFGVKIKHIVLDYGGNFFRLTQKTPWNPQPAAEGEVE